MAKDLTQIAPTGQYVLVRVDEENGLSPVFVGTVMARGSDVSNEIGAGDVVVVARASIGGIRSNVQDEVYVLYLVPWTSIAAIVTGDFSAPSTWT